VDPHTNDMHTSLEALNADGAATLEDSELFDSFLDTLCADQMHLDDAALFNDHDMLLTEAEAGLGRPTVGGCGIEADHTADDWISHQAALDHSTQQGSWLQPGDGGDFLDGQTGCPVVDLMFDIDSDEDFAAGRHLQFSCSLSSSEGRSNTQVVAGSAPLLGTGQGVGNAAQHDSRHDPPVSGHAHVTPDIVEDSMHAKNGCMESGTEPSDQCNSGFGLNNNSIACMNGGEPSASDSEVVFEEGAQEKLTLQRSSCESSGSQLTVSLTHAEVASLPNVLAAAQRVRRALAPRQCKEVESENVSKRTPSHASAFGKENSSNGVAAAAPIASVHVSAQVVKSGSHQGQGKRGKPGHSRGQKRNLHSCESDSEDEWIPDTYKPCPGARRKVRSGKTFPIQDSAPVAHIVSTVSGSSGSHEENGITFMLPEASAAEPSSSHVLEETRIKLCSTEASRGAEAAANVSNVSNPPAPSLKRPKKPLKLKLKALRRTDRNAVAAVDTDTKAAITAVVTGASPTKQQLPPDDVAESSLPVGTSELTPANCCDSSDVHNAVSTTTGTADAAPVTTSPQLQPPRNSNRMVWLSDLAAAPAGGKVPSQQQSSTTRSAKAHRELPSNASCEHSTKAHRELPSNPSNPTTESSKSAAASTDTLPQHQRARSTVDVESKGAPTSNCAVKGPPRCEQNSLKKQRVSARSLEPVSSSETPPQPPQTVDSAAAAGGAQEGVASQPQPQTAATAGDVAAQCSGSTDSPSNDTDKPTISSQAAAEDKAKAKAVATTSGSTPPAPAPVAKAATVKQHNPLKRTLDRCKSASHPSTSTAAPLASSTSSHQRKQLPPAAYAHRPTQLNRQTTSTPDPSQNPPMSRPHPPSRYILPPKPPRAPHTSSGSPSRAQSAQRDPNPLARSVSTGASLPATQPTHVPVPVQHPHCPPHNQLRPHIVAYVPQVPHSHPGACAPIQHVPAPPPHPPMIPAQPFTALQHACGPYIVPAHMPRAPNAVYLQAEAPQAHPAPPLITGAPQPQLPLTMVRRDASASASAPQPQVIGHFVQQQNCSSTPCPHDATNSEAQKLELEPMPDLSVLCDIMRAAEAPPPVTDTCGHTDMTHSQAHDQAQGTSTVVADRPPPEPPIAMVNPNKAKRERLKALTEGSSRNIAEWGRRQGYHREPVRSTAAKHRGVGGGRGKSHSAAQAKKPGEESLHKAMTPGRSQQAMRNRGAQPLSSTMKPNNKKEIALPNDEDLFGC
jgi:hypothetical protein